MDGKPHQKNVKEIANLERLISEKMVKLLFAFIFFSTCCFSDESCKELSSYETLLNSSQRYIDFIEQYGNDFDEEDDIDVVRSIFASEFKRVMNGQINFETCESFLHEMQEIKSDIGGWQIQMLDFALAAQDNKSFIYYRCSTNEGVYLTVSILHFNTDGLIDEVVTVWADLCPRPK